MRVIAVGSGGTGTGKTLITALLGAALADRGLRACLVDLDLAGSDLHVLYGLPHGPGVSDVLRDPDRRLESLARPVPGRPNLALVPGADETVGAASLRRAEIDHLLAGIDEMPADVVVVEAPAGLAPPILDLLGAADLALVVGLPDPMGLLNAARLVRLAAVRCAAQAPLGEPRARAPRVYGSLDALVRDMNALRAAPAGGRRFTSWLALNRVPSNAPRPGWGIDDPAVVSVVEIPDDPRLAQRGPCTPLPEAPGGPAWEAVNAIAGQLVTALDAVPAVKPGEPWPRAGALAR